MLFLSDHIDTLVPGTIKKEVKRKDSTMYRKILLFLLTITLALTAIPEGAQGKAVAKASANIVTTNAQITARSKQQANAHKKKKGYGVFLSIDATGMKKLYNYKEVVIDAQYFSKSDIQTLHKKGVDGFFIDNCDVYDYAKTRKNFVSLVKILKNIKAQKKEVIINGGDVFVKKYKREYGSMKGIMTAVNQETVWSRIIFDKGRFGKQPKDVREYFLNYVKLCKKDGIKVYLLEYTKNKKLINQIDSYCKKNKFKYYVSDSIELD